jgi:hypothetical protein
MGNDSDKIVSGLLSERDLCKVREAVCIQVEKIYDSCKEKDCIENARVRFYDLSHHQRETINNAFNVKIRKSVIKDVITDIEPVPFKRGFYTVDVKFIIKVTLDFFVHKGCKTEIETIKGEISFDKKIILFGSEGNVKIFKTHFEEDGLDVPVKSRLQQDNLPVSKVEVAEPIPLNAKIRGILDKLFEDEHDDDDNELSDETRCIPTKRVFVTVGIFSIIKLVRLVQLLIPAFDFCVPQKQCIASTEENPCELFETISFPVDQFFPPQIFDFPGALESEKTMIEGIEGHKHNHGHEGSQRE